MIFGFIFITIKGKTLKFSSDQVKEYTDVQLAHVLDLISKLAKFGTFWPFVGTFGIESVTRLMKIFFRHLISVKTINGSAKCGCTIHTTLFF